jgi:CelD/BcsL family acetyltransferase involved in cellulose biosynthesis
VSSGLEVRAVSTLAELAGEARAWDRLLEANPRALPFGSYAWMSAFFQHRVPPGARWCCLLARRDGGLVGVLPLVIAENGRAGVASTPADEHTFSVEPAVQPGREAEVIPALLAAAFRMIPSCVRVDLPRLPVQSPALELARAGTLDLPTVVSLADFGAYLPIEGDFAEFRGRLSRNFRNNINKAANKLAKMPGAEIIFKNGTQASSQDLQAFLQVEASSWKGDSGTAILKSPELTAFYTTLTERLAAAGWLEWQLLRAEGKLIAGNLAVALGSSTVIWKLGYDQEHARMSPGTLLFEKVVMRAHEKHGAPERGGGEINLLTNYDWYDNWEMRRRRYETLQVYAAGLANRLLRYWPRRLEQTARDSPAVVSAVRRLRDTIRNRQPPPSK